MPSFFVADLGEMSFTLGLSGWTANDWSSASQLDLMAPRDEVDSITLQKVFLTLKENWFLSGQNLARKLSLPLQTIERSLAIFTQAGKVVFDIENQVYRVRELAKDGRDIETLRFSGDTERNGVHLALKGVYSDYQEKSYADHIALSGKFKGHGNTFVKIDWDDHIIDGACGCSYFYKNGLKKGPCEHIIALRMIRKKKQNY
jgi:biotin operon repressor